MKLDVESDIIGLVEEVSRALGNSLQVKSTRSVKLSEARKDSAHVFLVDGKRSRDDIVLKISNDAFPETVEEDVVRARQIAQRVGESLGQHIVSPVYQGRHGEKTFAVYARLMPMSDKKITRYFQRSLASKKILPWLIDLAERTKHVRNESDAYEQYFVRPLEVLCDDKDISTEVKDTAGASLEHVRTNRGELFTVFEHGDLWKGNVLFQPKHSFNLTPTLGDFGVIDWGGAKTDGYPCIDLARYCASVYRIGAPQTDSLVSRYLETLKITQLDMAAYCMLSLGRLSDDLNQFSKANFCTLSERVSRFVQTHTSL